MRREINRPCANEQEAALEANPRIRTRAMLGLGWKSLSSHISGERAEFQLLAKTAYKDAKLVGDERLRLLELQSDGRHSISDLGGRKRHCRSWLEHNIRALCV